MIKTLQWCRDHRCPNPFNNLPAESHRAPKGFSFKVKVCPWPHHWMTFLAGAICDRLGLVHYLQLHLLHGHPPRVCWGPLLHQGGQVWLGGVHFSWSGRFWKADICTAFLTSGNVGWKWRGLLNCWGRTCWRPRRPRWRRWTRWTRWTRPRSQRSDRGASFTQVNRQIWKLELNANVLSQELV